LQERGAKKKFAKRNAEISNLILQREFATANSHRGKHMFAQIQCRVFSRSAERDQRPTALDPCRLLKKAGENFHQTDETF
jgi:hypothetical protein